MLAYAAVTRSPALQECTAASILRGAIIGAQLGLDCSGVGGEAYLVPFNNRKSGKMEAVFMTGYKGLIKLAIRSGQIVMVEACEVYSTDQFKVVRGTQPGIYHEPSMLAAPGDLVGFYAVATHANGMKQFEAMTKTQVDAVKSRSKAGQSGPWVSDYGQMGKKTAIRRLANYLPLSPELMVALEIDDRFEREQSQSLSPALDVALADPAEKAAGAGKGARKLSEAVSKAKTQATVTLASTGDDGPAQGVPEDDPGAGLRDEREPGAEG